MYTTAIDPDSYERSEPRSHEVVVSYIGFESRNQPGTDLRKAHLASQNTNHIVPRAENARDSSHKDMNHEENDGGMTFYHLFIIDTVIWTAEQSSYRQTDIVEQENEVYLLERNLESELVQRKNCDLTRREA